MILFYSWKALLKCLNVDFQWPLVIFFFGSNNFGTSFWSHDTFNISMGISIHTTTTFLDSSSFFQFFLIQYFTSISSIHFTEGEKRYLDHFSFSKALNFTQQHGRNGFARFINQDCCNIAAIFHKEITHLLVQDSIDSLDCCNFNQYCRSLLHCFSKI